MFVDTIFIISFVGCLTSILAELQAVDSPFCYRCASNGLLQEGLKRGLQLNRTLAARFVATSGCYDDFPADHAEAYAAGVETIRCPLGCLKWKIKFKHNYDLVIRSCLDDAPDISHLLARELYLIKEKIQDPKKALSFCTQDQIPNLANWTLCACNDDIYCNSSNNPRLYGAPALLAKLLTLLIIIVLFVHS